MPIFNNANPLKFQPTTPIQLYTKKTEYVSGQGNVTTWEQVKSGRYDTFYCQWQTMYGDRALTAESLGVKESATIRTFFNPAIYNKITRAQTLIVKNLDKAAFKNDEPDESNPNVYELWGGVDNVLEENLFMEFRARRYENL